MKREECLRLRWDCASFCLGVCASSNPPYPQNKERETLTGKRTTTTNVRSRSHEQRPVLATVSLSKEQQPQPRYVENFFLLLYFCTSFEPSLRLRVLIEPSILHPSSRHHLHIFISSSTTTSLPTFPSQIKPDIRIEERTHTNFHQ